MENHKTYGIFLLMLATRCRHGLVRTWCADCDGSEMVSPFGFLPLQLDEPYPTRSEKLDAKARREAYHMVPFWWESHHIPQFKCYSCGDLLDSQFEDHFCHEELIPEMIQDDIKLVFDDSDSSAVGIDAINENYGMMGSNMRFISEQCYDGGKVTFPEPQIPTVLKPRTRYKWGTGSARAGSFQIDISNFSELELGKPSCKTGLTLDWSKCLPMPSDSSKPWDWYQSSGDELQAPTKPLDGLVNWKKPEWLAKRLNTEDTQACKTLIDLWIGMDATYDMVQGGFYHIEDGKPNFSSFIDRVRKNDSIYTAIVSFSKWALGMDEVTVEWDNKHSTDRPYHEIVEHPEEQYIRQHLPTKYHDVSTEEDEMNYEEEREYRAPGVHKYVVKGITEQDSGYAWVSKQPEWYQALHQRVSRMTTPLEIHTAGSLVFFGQQLYKVETLEDLNALQKQFNKNKKLKDLLKRLDSLASVRDVLMDTFSKWLHPMSYNQSRVFWNEHSNRKYAVECGTASTYKWLYTQISRNPNRKALSGLQRSGKYQLTNGQWNKLWKLTEQGNDQYFIS